MGRLVVASLAVAAVASLPADGRGSRMASELPWVLDGEVHALAVAAGRVFVGGEFRQVSSPTGPLVAFTRRGRRDARFAAADVGGGVEVAIGDGRGGLYLGGSFKTIGGVACRSLAHVRSGGAVDRSFCPRPNRAVRALARWGSRLYVGGEFSRIAGVARQSLAALDLRTGQATAFRVTNPPYSFWQLAATPSAIYAVGDAMFVALDPMNGKRLPFAPNADVTHGGDSVSGFALAGSRIYAWGSFTRIGGRRCTGLAAVDAQSGKALDCQPRTRLSAAVVSRGILYAGGWFESADGSDRPGLAAFAADSGRRLPWQAPALPADIDTLAVHHGVLYAAGAASARSSSGSILAARSVASGAVIPLAVPRFHGDVAAIASMERRIVVGGNFTSLGGRAHHNLLAVNAQTEQPLPWQARISADGAVHELSAAGATLYVGGVFSRAGGRARDGFAAFDTRSGRALSWTPPLAYVQGLAANPNGVYTATNPVNEEQLFALDSQTGALRQTLATPAGTGALAAHGNLVYIAPWAAGQFALTVFAGRPLQLAATFTYTVDAMPAPQALAADARGVYLGGAYEQLPGLNQAYLARLRLEEGALRIDEWQPRLPGPVTALSLDGDTVVAAGFTTPTRWYVALVDSLSARVSIVGYGRFEGLEWVNAVAATGHHVYAGGAFGLQRFPR